MAFDNTEWIARWRGLKPRERVLAGAGLLAVAAALFYVAVYAPLQDANVRMRQQLQAQQALSRHLQAVATKAGALRTSGGATLPTPSAIDDSLAEWSLNTTVTRTTATPEGPFDFTIDGADFDACVQWLVAWQRQGLIVKSLELRRVSAEGGTVRGRLTLIQPGPEP